MLNYKPLVLLILWVGVHRAQPFPPPAGQAGSTAISKDSNVFVSWAMQCSITRGLQDCSQPALGYASAGDASDCLGKDLSPMAVSLGDGGYAVCEFESPIFNGPGYDFAVFENAFNDFFLELAFVEVSSNGTHFYRFPCSSLSSTLQQTGPFDSTLAQHINGLAGKYRAGYGTPFDLDSIPDNALLDKQHIRFVKIKDVVGSLLNPYKSLDSFGRIVNDPWPTPFPSSGFDLDAIGVIHAQPVSVPKFKFKSCTLNIQNPIRWEALLALLNSEKKILLLNGMGQTIKENHSYQGLVFLIHENNCTHKLLSTP